MIYALPRWIMQLLYNHLPLFQGLLRKTAVGAAMPIASSS
jgi:hypothetical protein